MGKLMGSKAQAFIGHTLDNRPSWDLAWLINIKDSSNSYIVCHQML